MSPEIDKSGEQRPAPRSLWNTGDVARQSAVPVVGRLSAAHAIRCSAKPVLPRPMKTPTSNAVHLPAGPRGRLLTAQQIATTIFNQPQRSKWVRQTVAPTKKITLGHSTVFWWELDVMDWIDEHCG